MTMFTTVIGLLPIMWSSGTGADVMKRIAAPMVGGITTSVAMELILYPVIFYLWQSIPGLPDHDRGKTPSDCRSIVIPTRAMITARMDLSVRTSSR